MRSLAELVFPNIVNIIVQLGMYIHIYHTLRMCVCTCAMRDLLRQKYLPTTPIHAHAYFWEEMTWPSVDTCEMAGNLMAG